MTPAAPGQSGGFLSREEAIECSRLLTEAINRHDVPAIMDLYAEDATLTSPMYQHIAGREAIAHTWHAAFSNFPDWQVEVSNLFVEGDRIALYGAAGATDRKGWFGLPPTGERFSYRAVILLTLANGKIIRDERLYDLTELLARLEKARLEHELRTAAEVQSALLSSTARAGEYFDAAGDSVACRTIGGDFFEFLELPSGSFGVALGDVAGKGPAAALLAAMVQGMFTFEARTGQSPSRALTNMNQALTDRGLDGRFVTLVYGILSPHGRFVHANAGHNAPVLLGRSGVRRLSTGGPVLGALKDAAYEEETFQLERGDAVIMFSDGVTEARNDQEEEFGEQRLLSSLAPTEGRSSSEIVKRVLSSVRAFSQDQRLHDDITVAVTRFLGE